MRRIVEETGTKGKTPEELLNGEKEVRIQFLEDFVIDGRNGKTEIKAGTMSTMWNSATEEAPVVSISIAREESGYVAEFLSKEMVIPARAVPKGVDETIEAIQGMSELSRTDLRFILEIIYSEKREWMDRQGMEEKVNIFAKDGDAEAREEYLTMRSLRARATKLFNEKLAGNKFGVHVEIPMGRSKIKLDTFTCSPTGSWVLHLNRPLRDGHMSHDNQMTWIGEVGKELVLGSDGVFPVYKFDGYFEEFKSPTPYHLLCDVLEKV